MWDGIKNQDCMVKTYIGAMKRENERNFYNVIFCEKG